MVSTTAVQYLPTVWKLMVKIILSIKDMQQICMQAKQASTVI